MVDETLNQRAFSLRRLLGLTVLAASLLAFPPIVSNADVSLAATFWIVAIHKSLLFSTVAYLLWLALARNRMAGRLIAIALLFVCLPDIMLSADVTFTGTYYKTFDLLDCVGLAESYERSHGFLYKLFGFSFSS